MCSTAYRREERVNDGNLTRTELIMKILVCGGRDYENVTAVDLALCRVHAKKPITKIIHGAARGADTLAKRWAEQNGIPHVAYPADWEANGKGAGPIRNQQMLDAENPDGVVAFPGGSGTADMVRRAIKAGVKVWKPEG